MTNEAKALVERSENIRSQMYLDLVANDTQHKAMLDLIETQAREIAAKDAENERLREALEWYVAEDAKYMRAALNEDTRND